MLLHAAAAAAAASYCCLGWLKFLREVVALLRELKKEATLLVVSHDLADIAPLVDCAWRMHIGGRMEAAQWPPDSLSDMED